MFGHFSIFDGVIFVLERFDAVKGSGFIIVPPFIQQMAKINCAPW